MSTALMPMPSFEELSRLARERPGDFEALRASLVEDFIVHAPTRLEPRLRGLQFRIDQTRKLAKTDYGAALRVFNMMWESFESLAALWRDLPGGAENGMDGAGSRRSAKVLELPVQRAPSRPQ